MDTKIPLNALTAMGLFWIFFGLVLFTAIFFVPDTLGRWTDFICSIIFLALGLFTFSKGFKQNK